MPDVFISYARSTASFARAVSEALSAGGLDVWSDDELPPHRAYADVIEEKLRSSKAVLVIWSLDAIRSQWVRAEAELARELGTLVQVAIDASLPPLPFNQIQCASLAGWSVGEASPAWDRVLASIAELVGSERQARSDRHLADSIPEALSPPKPRGRSKTIRQQISGRWWATATLVLLAGVGAWLVIAHYIAQQAMRRTTPDALRAALASYLASSECAWLDVDPESGPDGPLLKLSGLAGDPSAVRKRVGVLIDAAGLSAHVDASDLNRVGPQACGPLNTFLKFRQSPSMGAIALPRGDFSFHDRPSGCDPAAGMQAKTMAVITVPPASDFTLVGMEPSGRLQQVLADRADFEAHIKSNPTLFASERGSFLSYLCVDERTGAATPLIIEVLVQGQGPFNFTPLNTDQSDASAVDADWQDRFWANARVNGWKTEIAWFRVHK